MVTRTKRRAQATSAQHVRLMRKKSNLPQKVWKDTDILLQSLPEEILQTICSFASPDEVCRLSLTSKHMYTVCRDDCVWFAFCQRLKSSVRSLPDCYSSFVSMFATFLKSAKFVVFGGDTTGSDDLIPHTQILDYKGKWYLGPKMPRQLAACGSASGNGQVFLALGTESFNDLNFGEDIQVFDLPTETWSALQPFYYSAPGQACALIGNHLYTFSDPSGKVVQVDTVANKQQLLVHHFFQSGCLCTAFNNAIYVVDQNPGSYVRCVRYEPHTSTFTELARVPDDGSSLTDMIACGDFLFVMGTSRMLRYDPAVDAWTTCQPMPTPRSDYCAAASFDRVFVASGYTQTGRLPTKVVESYDPLTDSWRAEPSLPIAVAFASAGGSSFRA